MHQYPTPADTKLENNGVAWLVEDGLHALRLPWTQYACDSLHKPLFVGEFGQPAFRDGKEQDAPWLLDFLTPRSGSEAPLTALWSWEFAPTDPTQSPDFAVAAAYSPRYGRPVRRQCRPAERGGHRRHHSPKRRRSTSARPHSRKTR